jgi:hypothetical protein
LVTKWIWKFVETYETTIHHIVKNPKSNVNKKPTFFLCAWDKRKIPKKKMPIALDLHAFHRVQHSETLEYKVILKRLEAALRLHSLPLVFGTSTYDSDTIQQLEWDLQLAGYWFTTSLQPVGLFIDIKPHANKEVLIVNYV